MDAPMEYGTGSMPGGAPAQGAWSPQGGYPNGTADGYGPEGAHGYAANGYGADPYGSGSGYADGYGTGNAAGYGEAYGTQPYPGDGYGTQAAAPQPPAHAPEAASGTPEAQPYPQAQDRIQLQPEVPPIPGPFGGGDGGSDGGDGSGGSGSGSGGSGSGSGSGGSGSGGSGKEPKEHGNEDGNAPQVVRPWQTPKARLALLVLACATVCAGLAVGCTSSGSHKDTSADKDTPSAPSVSTSSTPTLDPAKFRTLPSSCSSVAHSTVGALVPKAKSSKGTTATTGDSGTRGGCSWTGNGKDGYQYRWLSVTLERYDTTADLGSGDDQARNRYTQELASLGRTKGFTTSTVSGLGDQAGSVSGKATVSKVTSQNDTVVARTGNVVVIVEYNGAGLEGKKNPSASDVDNGAQRAAKDAVAAVAAANGSANASGTPSTSASGTATSSGKTTSSPTGSPTGKPTGTSSSSPSSTSSAKATS